MDRNGSTNQTEIGFPPVYDRESRILILGSFPSVKSRAVQFYYGNPQNRFWSTVCGFFSESVPQTTEGKKDFLARRKIALWDIATECEIVGSSDASLKNAVVADLTEIFQTAQITKILLNGALAYKLFCQKYAGLDIPYVKLPSTSPANPRFDKTVWWRELHDV